MRIAVLGGGPGGYSAAFEAARLGAEVTLVERERLGGTCLNWGCIPTKTILRSAHIVGDTRHAADYGLVADDRHRRRPRASRPQGGCRRRARGPDRGLREAAQGRGRLRRRHADRPQDHQRRSHRRLDRTVEADAVILATGSVPFLLPNIDHSLSRVWTSDEATALGDIPAEIVIIGGGVIGLEFADAYANFGSTGARRRAHAGRAARQRQARPARGAKGARGARRGVPPGRRRRLGRAGGGARDRDAHRRCDTRGRRGAERARTPPERAGLRLPRGGHRDGPRRRQGRRVLPHERRRRLRHRRSHRRDDAGARGRGRG